MPTLNIDTQWISMEDEFPEDNTSVIAFDGDFKIISGYASELGEWIWHHSDRKFTHFMSLPKPPLQ